MSKLPPINLKSDATSPVKPHKPLSPEIKKADLPLFAPSPLPSGPIKVVDASAIASPSTLVPSPTSDISTVLVLDPHVTQVDVSKVPEPPSSTPSLDGPESSPQHSATPVSGDILLPLIIFSVVKSNPPHLVSHLLYTQRFRNQRVGGEESYCMINLMAVAEFLENVDLGALGLGDSEKKVIRYAFNCYRMGEPLTLHLLAPQTSLQSL